METPCAFGLYAFNSIASSCTLTVPYGTRDAYIAAGWTGNVFKGGIVEAPAQNIVFADANVKALCVANWDANGDGELSEAEAAAVTDLGMVFKQNTSITSFDELQYFTGLTSIEQHAFAGCHGLTSVTIPESVTSIGEDAFRYCSGLTSVIIPESVTSIGTSAFYDCGLTSVTIPNSVTTIGEYAFSYCSGLTSVIIPESVTSIGECAFNGCSSLSSVTIPESVTSIGNLTFEGCISLTSVTIPKGVTSIGDGAFSSCSGLASVTLLEGVKSIGSSAFYNCSCLTSVTLPNSVTSIGSSAFADCSSLSSVVAKMETPFRSFAFSNIGSSCVLTVPYGTRDAYIAAGWTEDVFKGGIIEAPAPNIDFADANVKALCVANWDANGDGELSEAEAAAVTDLGTVFKGNTTIQSFDELQYFTGLTSIGWEAFAACTSLTSVIIPNSITVLDDRSFSGTALENVALPFSVTEIRQGTFMNCGKLKSINVPEGVQVITLSSFQNTPALKSITLPNGITSIEHDAFAMSGIEAINLPDSLTSIGERAFQDCNGLTSVLFPSSLTSIENRAFDRSGLTSIELPVGVKTVGFWAFSDCKSLTSVVLSEGITTFNNAVFAGCNNLTNVNWPSDLTTISPWILSITIPETVTEIGDHAFYNCNGLTEIIIPASVTSIGYNAFYGCNNLKRINDWTTTSTDYFHFNSWSSEEDGSGITTPFIELWRGAGNMLNDATITHNPITGLTPGLYTVKILARAYNEGDSTTYPSGVTFFANDASVKLSDVCMRSVYNSEIVGQSALLYGELSLDCTVGQDGVLNLGFQIEDAGRCCWRLVGLQEFGF